MGRFGRLGKNCWPPIGLMRTPSSAPWTLLSQAQGGRSRYRADRYGVLSVCIVAKASFTAELASSQNYGTVYDERLFA